MNLDFQDFEFADDIDDYEEIKKGQFIYLGIFDNFVYLLFSSYLFIISNNFYP